MKMTPKFILSISSFLILMMITYSCKITLPEPLKSPDNNIAVEVFVEDGKVLYNVLVKEELVMKNSQLGIQMSDIDFTNNLKLVSSSDVVLVNENYNMLYGKHKECSYNGNKKIFHFENENGERMDIIFRVSNDGIGFRYYFPKSDTLLQIIKEEKTSFHFLNGTMAWMQPCADSKSGWSRTNPSYEELYQQEIATGTPSPFEAGWVFPTLFNFNDTWLLISETGLDANYCGTRLKQNSPDNEYFIGFPQAAEVSHTGELYPQSSISWFSPWRIIAIGSLKTIVETTLGTDLAIPAINGDFSFVKPGRSAWSWVLLKDDSTIYPVQKRFIDYAADMGWEYCLIDADWDKKIGYDKIHELVDYAKKKNVGIILWYNSSGDWNDTPYSPKSILVTKEDRMKEFKKVKEMGVVGLKIDFFGGDGKSVIQYYHDILNDAAEVGLMINFHGCTLPRGLQRTYPNLVNMEAVRGMEFLTFDQYNDDLASNHNAMLPFTRNVFDPMDYTPVCFSEIPGFTRYTTQSHELALAVLYLGGIQHYAETPTGMKKVPDYIKELMKEIPIGWDETKFIDGYPGKVVIIARRSGNTWYIAGINGENEKKEVTIDLSFIQKTNGIHIHDGENNRSFVKENIQLIDSKELSIHMIENGGFLIKL